MNLNTDDFILFDLPRRFAQDRATLDARWKALQAEVHPDRFAAQGAAAQRVAMQWAVRVNEAYQRLKNPLKRAAYLCELNGAQIGAESNTSMPTDFLLQQMAWREALEEAASADELERLNSQVSSVRTRALERLEQLLDREQNFAGAAQQVRGLMFIEKFVDEVDLRQEALDS